MMEFAYRELVRVAEAVRDDARAASARDLERARVAEEKIRELELQLRQTGAILSSINDAIGRAGINVAITFVEAIDQIAYERDLLRARLADLEHAMERS